MQNILSAVASAAWAGAQAATRQVARLQPGWGWGGDDGGNPVGPGSPAAVPAGQGLQALQAMAAAPRPDPHFARMTPADFAAAPGAPLRGDGTPPTPLQIVEAFTVHWHERRRSGMPVCSQSQQDLRAQSVRLLRGRGLSAELAERLGFALHAMDKACDLLARRMRSTFGLLHEPAVVARIEAAGSDVRVVQARLCKHANALVQYLQYHALQGRPVASLVPRRRDLLAAAIDAPMPPWHTAEGHALLPHRLPPPYYLPELALLDDCPSDEEPD